MAIPKNTIGDRDRGKRLYVGRGPYQRRMRTRTIAEYDRSWQQRQSESKKPWKDADYPEMEYHFDPWTPVIPPHTPPNLPPDSPWTPPVDGPPTGNRGGSPGKDPSFYPFLGCDFWGDFSPDPLMPGEWALSKFYLGPDETGIREIEVSGPVDLVGLNDWMKLTGPEDQRSFGENWFMVIAWDAGKIASDPHYNNVIGDIPYHVQVRTNSYFAAQYLTTSTPGEIAQSNPWYSFGVCIAKGSVKQCPPEIIISWDSEESATTIGRNDSKVVKVNDGLPPYTWSIAGTGFSLAAGKTTSKTNRVDTDGTACGVGSITVRDACGDETQGEILCTFGAWADTMSCSCLVTGNATQWSDSYRWIVQAGSKRCNEYWEWAAGSACSEDFCTEWDCDGRCYDFEYCQHHDGLKCGCSTPCVTDKNPPLYWIEFGNHLCFEYEPGGGCACFCKGALSRCQEYEC